MPLPLMPMPATRAVQGTDGVYADAEAVRLGHDSDLLSISNREGVVVDASVKVGVPGGGWLGKRPRLFSRLLPLVHAAILDRRGPTSGKWRVLQACPASHTVQHEHCCLEQAAAQPLRARPCPAQLRPRPCPPRTVQAGAIAVEQQLNKKVYGQEVSPKALLEGEVRASPAPCGRRPAWGGFASVCARVGSAVLSCTGRGRRACRQPFSHPFPQMRWVLHWLALPLVTRNHAAWRAMKWSTACLVS